MATKTGKREQQKEDRKRRILLAAKRSFSKMGYSGTTLEQIAEEAELATGTVYNYFPTKAALLPAVLEEAEVKYIADIDRAVARKIKNPKKGIEQLINEFLKFSKELNKDHYRHYLAASFIDRDHVLPIIRAGDMYMISAIEKLVKKYQDQGVLCKQQSANRISQMIYGLCVENIILYLRDPNRTGSVN